MRDLLCRAVFLPFAGEVENKADPERGEAGKGVAQPEAVVLHAKRQTKQQCKTNAHDDAVQNCGGEVDPVVAAAVDQCIHHCPQGTCEEQQNGDGNIVAGDGKDHRFICKNAEDLIKKYKLFGSDAKGLYELNQELLARVYAAPSLVL